MVSPDSKAAGVTVPTMPRRPDITLNQLRGFVAVARHGSVTGAANALSVPQPAVSRLVKRLESLADTPLLIRSGHGVSLTTAGQHFLENAEQVLHFHDRALDELQTLRETLAGEVRLAAPDSVGAVIFAPLVKQFREFHRNAAVRTIAAHSSNIPSMLDTNAADLGIVADTHPRPTGNVEALFTEELYLVGPADAPETRPPTIPLSDVARLPLILNALPGGFRSVTDKAFASSGLTPDVVMEIDTNGPLIDLVEAGEGFAILPFSVVCRHSATLAASRIVEPVMARTLSLAVARNRPVSTVWREAARLVRLVIRAESRHARWTIKP